MAFLMDGVQELRDLKDTNPELSRFKYVVDPVFEPFPGKDKMRTFKEGETHIHINVSK